MTLTGDANSDGRVDNADLKILLANTGKRGSASQGDFNGDGKINFADFQIFEQNFGQITAAYNPFGVALPAGADAVPSGQVPEPAGALLGGVGLALAACRRRRPAVRLG